MCSGEWCAAWRTLLHVAHACRATDKSRSRRARTSRSSCSAHGSRRVPDITQTSVSRSGGVAVRETCRDGESRGMAQHPPEPIRDTPASAHALEGLELLACLSGRPSLRLIRSCGPLTLPLHSKSLRAHARRDGARHDQGEPGAGAEQVRHHVGALLLAPCRPASLCPSSVRLYMPMFASVPQHLALHNSPAPRAAPQSHGEAAHGRAACAKPKRHTAAHTPDAHAVTHLHCPTPTAQSRPRPRRRSRWGSS